MELYGTLAVFVQEKCGTLAIFKALCLCKRRGGTLAKFMELCENLCKRSENSSYIHGSVLVQVSGWNSSYIHGSVFVQEKCGTLAIFQWLLSWLLHLAIFMSLCLCQTRGGNLAIFTLYY